MPAPKYTPHYTISDYQQWEGDWELWNGVAVAMTPSPFGSHQKCLARLSQRLLNALDAANCSDCELAVELDWTISDDLVVRPDLSIVCGSAIEKFIEVPPSLIVEIVSPSTAHKDRTAKLELYERHAVKHYILVDPESGQIDWHRLTSSGHYQPLPPVMPISFELHPNCTIAVSLP